MRGYPLPVTLPVRSAPALHPWLSPRFDRRVGCAARNAKSSAKVRLTRSGLTPAILKLATGNYRLLPFDRGEVRRGGEKLFNKCGTIAFEQCPVFIPSDNGMKPAFRPVKVLGVLNLEMECSSRLPILRFLLGGAVRRAPSIAEVAVLGGYRSPGRTPNIAAVHSRALRDHFSGCRPFFGGAAEKET
jgi:hypothetical protein